MNYQTYAPHPDLVDIIKCYWTLEIPAKPNPIKQRAIADGYIEIMFHLADDVKSYTEDEGYTIQPRAMLLGHPIKPLFFEPTGEVKTFAVRFFPYAIANLITQPIKNLIDKVLPLHRVVDNNFAKNIEQQINEATTTQERIKRVEKLIIEQLNSKETIDQIVKNTIDTLIATDGNTDIQTILQQNLTSRRQLERKFTQQIGLSPKQLMKVIRLQTSLRMLLNHSADRLYQIAYDNDYYDQAHFTKDFKEFTGINPKSFWQDETMEVATMIYAKK